jgi:hypothetical protein
LFIYLFITFLLYKIKSTLWIFSIPSDLAAPMMTSRVLEQKVGCMGMWQTLPKSGPDSWGSVIWKESLVKWPSWFRPGANPTIVIYNASVVNFYNAKGSLARFEKNFLFSFEKHSSLLQRWRCCCKIKNRRIGHRHCLGVGT